jgi:outer membrane protein
MKKLSLTVKTIMACAVLAAAASCSKQEAATATPATDSEATAAPALKIAYIDADSIMSAYTLAKEIAEEGQRLMNNYNRQEQSKQQEIQKFGNNIEQKRQNNVYLSEASFQADVEKLQKMQNDAARHLTNQQNQIQNTIAQAQVRLNDSIMNAVNAYNATKGYDAILLRESGVYFNPELNVTADIIEVLNSRYTAAAK